MQMGTFRKNVMKTVGHKPAKLGLRTVSRNATRTTLVQTTVALKAHTGHLLEALTPYVLGEQFTPEMAEASLVSFGDIGYDLTVLCRALKVKMPTATKKVKMVGTRTAVLLTLDAYATHLLDLVHTGTFAGPQMTTISKSVSLPNKGKKEIRTVAAVDVEAEKQMEGQRQQLMADILAQMVDTYWRLCFDVYKQPPVVAFAHKFARMQQDHPHITFDVKEEAEEADDADEAATPALVGAATA